MIGICSVIYYSGMQMNISQKSSLTTMKASQSTSSSHFSELMIIVLDSNTYMAGDKVTGEILINATDSISPLSLELIASGVEEIHVYDEKDLKNPSSSDKSSVFSIQVPFPSSETLNPGSYVFPFSLKLPPHCPSTFEFFGRDNQNNYIKSNISYKICVSSTDGLKLSDYQIFIVKNKYSLTNPQISQGFTEEITGCCSKLGSSNYTLSILNTDHCEVNGDITFRLIPDNKLCKAPINRVISKICANLKFSTSKGTFSTLQEIAVIERATWVSSFSNTVFEKDFEYKCRLTNNDSMNISSNSTPLIQTEYFLQVFIFYDKFRGSDPVELILPFHVNPSNYLKTKLPKLPESWSPEERGILVVLWSAVNGFEIKDMNTF
jgi:hypothetical protein